MGLHAADAATRWVFMLPTRPPGGSSCCRRDHQVDLHAANAVTRWVFTLLTRPPGGQHYVRLKSPTFPVPQPHEAIHGVTRGYSWSYQQNRITVLGLFGFRRRVEREAITCFFFRITSEWKEVQC